MSFLPFVVLNLLLASFAAHFAFRLYEHVREQRAAIPVPARRAPRRHDGWSA